MKLDLGIGLVLASLIAGISYATAEARGILLYESSQGGPPDF